VYRQSIAGFRLKPLTHLLSSGTAFGSKF
jgi:hypothetical protein